MIVTVNTDASYHSDHKVGAFAFWIVCNQGRIMESGPLKEAINPTDAELRCICNALYRLLKSNFTGVTKIIINSDALYAFEKVGKKKKEEAGRVCAEILRKLKTKYNIPHYKAIHVFRHVKAHSGTETKRQWVNDWCDKKAKEQLWKSIHSKNKK